MLMVYSYFWRMNFSSKLIEQAVDEFAALPGIGRKTAYRFVLYLLKKDEEEVRKFGNSFIKLREQIKYCENCHNISETQLCGICSSHSRDGSLVCVVEDIRDVIAIENTAQFKGHYHVLGGIISPMDGIGPAELNVETLVNRVKRGDIKEIVMALSANMEGDTTNFYIFKKLKDFDVKISTIARGVAVGSELEYTDEVTLGRSIVNRVPYENSLVR
ncbi:MAG: Recombination protein RecR [Bacteroidia bacterium]|nr:Recombination protein RecR [Bacteroidia bacterium]